MSVNKGLGQIRPHFRHGKLDKIVYSATNNPQVAEARFPILVGRELFNREEKVWLKQPSDLAFELCLG